jgi:RNA polymerase sigma factor (sigma-70 family)
MNRDHSYIEQLVNDFQGGSEEAAQQLIDAFDPYLRKYTNLLKNNYVDLNNKDVRRFLLNFSRDREFKKNLMRHYQSSEVRAEAYKIVSLINKTCEVYTNSDIEHELIVILLVLAKRYKPEGKNFCNYVFQCFRYELARRLKYMTRDPIVYSSRDMISYDDFEYIQESNEVENNIALYTDDIMLNEMDDDLDFNWIKGYTCSECFCDLTTFERKLLVLTYQDNLTDVQISGKLGVHRHTVRNRRNRAIEKIQWGNNDAIRESDQ